MRGKTCSLTKLDGLETWGHENDQEIDLEMHPYYSFQHSWVRGSQ